VYLKRKDGTEIDLAVVTHNIEDNEIGAYLYGDTDTDDWTIKHTWSEEEIKFEEE
jgi:anti-sigma factor ChrR (cupin superfamily)